MKIELTKYLNSVSLALDYVENELLQAIISQASSVADPALLGENEAAMLMRVAPFHAKRVAVLANRMATFTGMDSDSVYALTQAALLHDCALSEYLDAFTKNAGADIMESALKPHCIAGERIVSELPFYDSIHSVVLYHHERADGNGPFGKHADEIPLGARLIHIADELDVRFSLNEMDEQKYAAMRAYVHQQRGLAYSDECVEAFFGAVDLALLTSITGEDSQAVVNRLLPNEAVDMPVDLLRNMSLIFADITDYKSQFTCRHSLGIAQKAEAMGKFYGYPTDTCDKLYIAGALHDIGKLFIANGILEKPGKLTSDEYKEIQNHAAGTWKMLRGIGGMEDITSWAANHHEKLDGSGYPYGKTADELGPNERLLACLDIYQALVEERPYKAGLSHEEAMGILGKMGAAGQLDVDILNDIDRCFSVEGLGVDFAAGLAADLEEDPDSGLAAADAPAAAHSGKREAENSKAPEYAGETWRCPVCGYIYEGPLPDDFICPRCEQPASVFERVG